MSQMKTFSSLAQKPQQQTKSQTQTRPKSEIHKKLDKGLWSKIGPSVIGIVLAVVVSGSIPFVKASYQDAEHTPTKLIQPVTTADIKVDNIEPFIWTARLKVEDLKLHHRLTLQSDTQNRIEVLGKISPQEELQWNAFLTWYDTKEGFPKLVPQVTADAVSGNIPDLKSVWFHKDPVAYFQDGSFGGVGSVLQDGWEIKNIEPWAILIERDGAKISIAYQ